MILEQLPRLTARTRDRSARRIERSSRAIADRISDRISDIPEQLEGIPSALGAVPQALQAVPEALGRVPDALGRVPDAIGRVPEALERIPKRVERIPRDIENLRRPRRKDPGPVTGLALLAGVTLGMAVMWFLDPQRGAHRRALILEKLTSWTRRASRGVSGRAEDREPRTEGLASEVTAVTRDEQVDDAVLVDRVRSQLGRVASEIGRIDVTASEGHVTLSGYAPAAEIETLLAETSAVRGVRSVENRLDVGGSGSSTSDSTDGSWTSPESPLELSRES